MCQFTHLHVHTEYSLLDGVNRIPKLMEKVSSSGMEAVAMTDHGVMYGLVEFWSKAKDYNLKPIIGCEIYISPGDHTERKEINGHKYYHLLLVAQNKVGFHNLVKLVSIAQLEGMYYRPRVDRETLAKYSEGLICTSACLASPIASHLVAGQEDIALDWLKFFKHTFPGRFYLELQRNGFSGSDDYRDEIAKLFDTDTTRLIKEQMMVNRKLRQWSEEYDLPLVATTDAHYLDDKDKAVQKILFCVKDGIKLNDPKAREGYLGTYIATPEEMAERFSDDKTPLENTMRIAEQVETYDIKFDRIQPHYWNTPENKTTQDELKEQTFVGAKIKYGEITPELEERIKYELEVIHDKGYDDYFLVVSDIMKWCAQNGILTGVRGSVAGSVVAHCLDIVELEPIGWELYFERFLNPERPSPPDIDMDIQDSRRDEVIAYIKDRYGENAVAAIAAIGRFKTKAAIRDVARVMGVDLAIADKLSKMVNVVFGKVYTIDKQMDSDPEFKQIIESSPQLLELAEHVRSIEGMARHMSVHACGHLITPDAIINFSPLQKETGGGDRVITQLEGPALEDVGLMKFDFLGLRTLTIIANAISTINKEKDPNLTFYNIPMSDPDTFALFSRGETMGIFQFESPPMRKYLQDLQPETLEDLCFMAAAYRPGPMKYIPDYILRKHGQQDVEYLTPELEPIVGKTFGFAIYQEQVIRIAVDLAGYSMGQADILRRAMGKKKLDVMQKEEAKFTEGILKRGLTGEIAKGLWEYLLPFADYGFNKAHSAGYAVLAYKCAYLKAHYPLEFMAALMHSDLGDMERTVIDIEESQRMGYQIMPPDINLSAVDFTTEGNNIIRFGLGAIKNVGEKICELIVQAREEHGPFKHLDDLVAKVGAKNINKKTLECLIMAGALDQFGSRNQLQAVLPQVVETFTKSTSVSVSLDQTSMFGVVDTSKQVINVNMTPYPDVPAESAADKIAWERELLGLFLSSHPLDEYYWLGIKKGFTTIGSIKKLGNDKPVKFAAIINHTKTITTKSSGQRMAFIQLEDVTGSIEGVIFPRDFEKLVNSIPEVTPLIISGKTNERDDKITIIVNNVESIKNYQKPKQLSLNICDVEDKDELEKMKKVLNNEKGELEVKIFYGSKFNPKQITRYANLSKQTVLTLNNYIIRD